MGAAYARPMAASAGYRGTIALHDAVIPAPISATALAITCWDDSFAMHGIQSLPTPPPPHPLGIGEVEITTDTGSTHHGSGAGGHGHPRFLWRTRFRPALPTGVTTLALSAKAMTDGATVTALIRLPHGPPTPHEAACRVTTFPSRARPSIDRGGSDLPDRVVALGVDLGVIADVRRVLTVLYCWPAWFLLTIEAAGGPFPVRPPSPFEQAWEMADDRGTTYLGGYTGGWSGRDNGAHIAFAPGLDPQARELRLTFPDPFGRVSQLTAVAVVPESP